MVVIIVRQHQNAILLAFYRRSLARQRSGAQHSLIEHSFRRFVKRVYCRGGKFLHVIHRCSRASPQSGCRKRSTASGASSSASTGCRTWCTPADAGSAAASTWAASRSRGNSSTSAELEASAAAAAASASASSSSATCKSRAKAVIPHAATATRWQLCTSGLAST